jgi:hypothetical protein
MKLTYRGTGTVSVEGAGEVSTGGTIDVPEVTGKALLQEQPEAWSVQASAKAPARPGGGGTKS